MGIVSSLVLFGFFGGVLLAFFIDVSLHCLLTASSWYVEKINDWATAGYPYPDAPPRNKKVSACLFFTFTQCVGILHFFTLKSLGALNKFFYVFLFFKDSSLPDDDGVLSAFLIIATYLWFACVEKDSENN